LSRHKDAAVATHVEWQLLALIGEKDRWLLGGMGVTKLIEDSRFARKAK
jgi:hypothetical protein